MTSRDSLDHQMRQRYWRCQGFLTGVTKDQTHAYVHQCVMGKSHFGDCMCWCDFRFKPDVQQPVQHPLWEEFLREEVEKRGLF